MITYNVVRSLESRANPKRLCRPSRTSSPRPSYAKTCHIEKNHFTSAHYSPRIEKTNSTIKRREKIFSTRILLAFEKDEKYSKKSRYVKNFGMYTGCDENNFCKRYYIGKIIISFKWSYTYCKIHKNWSIGLVWTGTQTFPFPGKLL